MLQAFVRACESYSRGSFPLYSLFSESTFALPVRFSTAVTCETILTLVRAFVRVFVRACTSGRPRSWQSSAAQPGFKLCSFSLHVRTATSVSVASSQR